jgi:type III pantothenate kinase
VLLAIDVGNTQTVLGLFSAEELVAHWRISSNAALTTDELRVKVNGLLTLDNRSWSDVSHVILASVVPRLTAAWEDVAAVECGGEFQVVGPGLKTGIDRLGGPVIVVDFGTATTIDVVDANGAYLGGAIAPGVETSAEALFTKAARLSKVDLEPPSAVIGTNTRMSVQAGLLLGEAAMVDGLVRRTWVELGTETPVIATGGLAERMSTLCDTITHVDPDLTLRGLLLIHQRNDE